MSASNAPSERRLHGDRARRWGCSAYMAEWFANSVAYCQTPKGRKEFKEWLFKLHGPVRGAEELAKCNQPPHKYPAGQGPPWADTAFELGVCHHAFGWYQAWTGLTNTCRPARTKPAPHRRRGESSSEWLVRRQRALKEGAKEPDVDLLELRKTATSQYDAIRDVMEIWRTQPNIFMEDVRRQSKSWVLGPDVEQALTSSSDPEFMRKYYTAANVVLNLLHECHTAHALWYRATKLFEELDRRDLRSPSAIERVCKTDHKLLGQITAVVTSSIPLEEHWRHSFVEVLSSCEHYRPFVKRFRDWNGVAHFEPNQEYIARHPSGAYSFDDMIVKHLTGHWITHSFLEYLSDTLDRSPGESSKFSQEAYDCLSNMALACEFRAGLTEPAFGERLRILVLSAINRDDNDHFLSEVSFMKEGAIHYKAKPSEASGNWGEPATLAHSLLESWKSSVWNIQDYLPQYLPLENSMDPSTYDDMWKMIDTILWNDGKSRDLGGGVLMETLGLYDPADPKRPTYRGALRKEAELRARAAIVEPHPSQATRYEPAIPTAAVTDSAAMSAHAYLAESRDTAGKAKTKRRGVAAEASATMENEEEAEEELPQLPEFLPSTFKLPRKVMKVFHRVLDPSPEDSTVMKNGQVRWGEFEKAMRRVGFDVVQTAGSSVRFDPPAKAARPIAFHRPHPDGVMPPHMLKVIGNRLNRTYGWTMATFTQATAEENNSNVD